MKRALIFIVLLVYCSPLLAFQNEELQHLWDISTSQEVKAKTGKVFKKGQIKVEEVYYQSRPYKRNPVKIFGYFAYPAKQAGKLPAILLVHGGGGTASLARSTDWAARGYAVFAIDLPGKGENRSTSRSTGPDMDVPTLLRTQPDPSYNYLIHAVAAARNAITYLTQRKEVDPKRIGMIGLSWGGVLTLLTNGQDNRLRAAVNVFGAGYIPEGCTWEDRFRSMPALDKGIWNNSIDPKNFLSTQHAPILFITGTNDHCYYLTTFQKSYLDVPITKNYFLIPNLRHKFHSSGTIPALAWLDQQLKKGGEFPTLEVKPLFKKADKVAVPFKVFTKNKVTSVKLHYTLGGPQQWTEKRWQEISATNGLFLIPTNILRPEILFYISAKDSRQGATSSLVRALFAVKQKAGNVTYAVSEPLHTQYRHEKPIVLVGTTEEASGVLVYSKAEKAFKLY